MGRMRWLTFFTLTTVLSGCATVTTPPPVESRVRVPERTTQIGPASWYGEFHQGRRTASGETFDMHSLTAAHPTLPLGTRVAVTNLANGRVVQVRINDRGPTVPGRVLDLSYGAARALHAVGDGVIPVKIEVLDEGSEPRGAGARPPVNEER
jgi:peptidoglycan lytic transglycosylase